jgi:DNA mismatch repair protein MutS2
MISARHLELLQFDRVREIVSGYCFSLPAKELASSIYPSPHAAEIIPLLERTGELRNLLAGSAYFPSVEHDDIRAVLGLLGLPGAMVEELALLRVMRSVDVANSMIRFLQEKRGELPRLSSLAQRLQPLPQVVTVIDRIIDPEGAVRNSASPELASIRKEIAEKRRESDRRFYHYVGQLRKLGYLRENEEGFFNGRRTLAVVSDYKSEISGFVHDKSESGKTIFIEPGATVSINNEIAELEIDERREIHRILRALCDELQPLVPDLRAGQDLLVEIDLNKAKALFAISLDAHLPNITEDFSLSLVQAYHPLLFLQNKRIRKATVPLTLTLNAETRLLVISGPNAGGKTIALKTVALLQVMLQSGLLVPVNENSTFCFFEQILIDIGDTQSIENELSTYSGKLKSMTTILEQANEASLVVMDEFGSGTDPELGGAIAEAVLESLVTSQARGIITSHFGNIKLLAEKLEGVRNASMLFDAESFGPRYILSVGEPGSSYTFEVAERIGFPKHLIERAKLKVDRDKLRLSRLLADVQGQKARLEDELQKAEHEQFLGRVAREKYQQLFDSWQQKIERERDKKIELSRLAEYGKRYLRLMEDWNKKEDRKALIKRFVDGITAETKKKEILRKQKKHDAYAEKKIARLKGNLKVGSRVRVLNGNEIGVVEEIRDEKVQVKFGIVKMTVGMENLVLAE